MLTNWWVSYVALCHKINNRMGLECNIPGVYTLCVVGRPCQTGANTELRGFSLSRCLWQLIFIRTMDNTIEPFMKWLGFFRDNCVKHSLHARNIYVRKTVLLFILINSKLGLELRFSQSRDRRETNCGKPLLRMWHVFDQARKMCWRCVSHASAALYRFISSLDVHKAKWIKCADTPADLRWKDKTYLFRKHIGYGWASDGLTTCLDWFYLFTIMNS